MTKHIWDHNNVKPIASEQLITLQEFITIHSIRDIMFNIKDRNSWVTGQFFFLCITFEKDRRANMYGKK